MGSLRYTKRIIMNIYKTLLTRGIRGTYVYVCDPELREYLRKYIPPYKNEESFVYSNKDSNTKVAEDTIEYEK